MTYKKALELNESRKGLDLESLTAEELVGLCDDIPGWDYPIAIDVVLELARRAGIDPSAIRDYNDICQAALEALGIS